MEGRCQRRSFAAERDVSPAEVCNGGNAGAAGDDVRVADLQGERIATIGAVAKRLSVAANGLNVFSSNLRQRQQLERGVAEGLTDRTVKLTEQNVEVLCGDADVIVDCFDNQASRLVLSSFAREPDKPLVHAAIAANKKIQAIKVYRQIFGTSLKDAKDAVDAMARGESVSHPVSRPTPPAGSAPTMDDVRAALANGKKILAIKHYREIHDVGLKEAKDAVEAL